VSVNKTCHKIKSTQFLICPLSLWQFSIVYCSDPLEKSLLNLSSISCRQKCPCQSNLPARALHSPILQQSVASCCSQHCAAVHNTVLLSTTLCYCPQHCSAVHNTVLLSTTLCCCPQHCATVHNTVLLSTTLCCCLLPLQQVMLHCQFGTCQLFVLLSINFVFVMFELFVQGLYFI